MTRNESGNVKGKSLISRQNLIEEESNDKELLDLFRTALTPYRSQKMSVGYLIKDNILMRKWSPTEYDNGEKWLDEEPEKIVS